MSWQAARLEALGLLSRAQIVTCASGQTQTTMTEAGSDIILYGLAGEDDGILIAMASYWRELPRIGLAARKRHGGEMHDMKGEEGFCPVRQINVN